MHEIRNKWRGKACARPDASEDQPIGNSTFMLGNPVGNKLVRGRKHHGFASSKQETHHHKPKQPQLRTARNYGRERGEYPPPHHSCRQHAPGAEAVSQPSTDRLEKCVAPQQCAENRPQLNIAQPVGFRNRGTRNRNVYAIEKGNGGENKNPEDKEPADMRRNLRLWVARPDPSTALRAG